MLRGLAEQAPPCGLFTGGDSRHLLIYDYMSYFIKVFSKCLLLVVVVVIVVVVVVLVVLIVVLVVVVVIAVVVFTHTHTYTHARKQTLAHTREKESFQTTY